MYYKDVIHTQLQKISSNIKLQEYDLKYKPHMEWYIATVNHTQKVFVYWPFWKHKWLWKIYRIQASLAWVNIPREDIFFGTGYIDSNDLSWWEEVFLLYHYIDSESSCSNDFYYDHSFYKALFKILAHKSSNDNCISKWYIHTDIDPSNVLYTKQGYKIIDFESIQESYTVFQVFELIYSFWMYVSKNEKDVYEYSKYIILIFLQHKIINKKDIRYFYSMNSFDSLMLVFSDIRWYEEKFINFYLNSTYKLLRENLI